MLNTTLLSVREGEGAQVQGAAGPALPERADYVLKLRSLEISTEQKTPTVQLRDLDFVMSGTRNSGEAKGTEGKRGFARLSTDIDIPAGQKVVVGKTSFASPDNAIVLALTAKVMD